MPNNDNEPFLKFDDFNGGVVDAFGQGKEPSNSLADSQNFTPFLKKSLITVHGYSKTGGLAALPTGFAKTSGTGTYDVAKIVSEIYPFSSANPVSYDGRVYFFTDNQGSPVNHVMLDTWFIGSTQAGPALFTNAFAPLDERFQFAGGADTTIAGATTHTITVANADTTYGLSTTSGYYTGVSGGYTPWKIAWTHSGVTKYGIVTNYAFIAHTATFTVKENIGTGGMNWTIQGAGDTFFLYRWFHSARYFVSGFTGPDFGTVPGQCFQSSGRVRGCGGPANIANYTPWISQYFDRTFFTGHANSQRYYGTYADEMRCRAPLEGIGCTVSATGGLTYPPAATYNFFLTYEFDGYEEGEIFYGSFGAVDGTTQVVIYDLFVNFAHLNKRITAINVYVSQVSGGVETDPYFLKRFDIVTPTTDQLDATYGWQWDNSTYKGYFSILSASGTISNASYQVLFDGNAWDGKGASYLARTGRVREFEKNSIVNWQYTEAVSGRQFFSNVYDFNTALLDTNSLRFTGFDINANGTTDIIPADPLYNQTNVSPGSGQAIQGLAGQNGWLYAFLNPGIYGFSITPYPEQWVKYPISLIDGLYSTKSLGKMPEGGGIYFADVDHFKLMNNQKIAALTVTIPNLYYNLSNKSSIRAWYDKLDRAICFSNGVSGQHYRGYSELQYPLTGNYLTGNLAMGVPWFPALYTDNIEFVAMLRDASIVFTNQTLNGVFQVHLNDQTFSGAGIVPYLKTNSYFMDDKDSVSKGLVDRVHVHLYDIGNTGTFDCKMTIDGDAHTFSNIDKTMGHIFMKYPVTVKRYGRHMFFEFNTNASGMYDISGDVQLTEIVFYGQNIRFFVKNET